MRIFAIMNPQQRQQLKARAHSLKPIVITGHAGVSAALLAEIDRALEHHELMKVRINAATREEARALAAQISEALTAELVQVLGHVVTLFREKRNKP